MKLLLASRQSFMNTIGTNCNNGFVKLYNGTKPANPDTALSGNTLLATLTFGATAFGSADANGVITANAITSEINAPATGTVTFARLFQSDATTVVLDLTTTELALDSLSIVAGTGSIGLNSLVLTFGVGS